MRADDLEQAADEAVRRPVGHCDATARARHAQHLARGARVVGREHHAEGGQHDVEAGVRVRQRFGVGDLEVHGQVLGFGAQAAFLQQLGHVVGGGHIGEAARRGQRCVTVAGGDVEHTFVGTHVGRFGEHFADNLQSRADDGVVAAGPGGLLALLDRGIVGLRDRRWRE